MMQWDLTIMGYNAITLTKNAIEARAMKARYAKQGTQNHIISYTFCCILVT